MVKLTYLLSLAALAASAHCSPLKRSVADLKADIVVISSKASGLQNDIQGLTSQNAKNVLPKIHNDGQDVAAAIGKVKTDVKNTPVASSSDSATLAKGASDMATIVSNIMGQLVAKHSIIASQGSSATTDVCTDISFFQVIALSALDFLLGVLQPADKATLAGAKSKMGDSFAATKKAYCLK